MHIDLAAEHKAAVQALETAAAAYHQARGAVLTIERLIALVQQQDPAITQSNANEKDTTDATTTRTTE